jgi:hypothetical protein
VEKLLKNLNPHKAAGPDNIRPMVLKELASEISPILSIIYNVSIKAGEIPDDWRSDRLLLKLCCTGYRMLFLSACLIM